MLIAGRLGRTVDELKRTMSAQEFGLWVQMYKDDPWDGLRDDYRFGQICATIANYAGKMRRDDAGVARPDEFMPRMRHGMQDEVEVDSVSPLEYFKQFQ